MNNNRCKNCNSSKTKRNGRTPRGIQRWICYSCNKSWSRKRTQYKTYSARKLFKRWLRGSSMNEIAEDFRLSKSTIQSVFSKILDKPIEPNFERIRNCKYAAFDGKYINHSRYCVITMYDTEHRCPVAIKVVRGEHYNDIFEFVSELKTQGFAPIAVTTDGRKSIPRAFKDALGGDVIMQRCKFHIENQVKGWVRRPPWCELGRELSQVAEDIFWVNSERTKQQVIQEFKSIKNKFAAQILALKKSAPHDPKARGMIRALSLIEYSIPDLFYFLDDPNIAETSSAVERFNRKIKKIVSEDHNGMTIPHLEKFLCHFINT